MLARLNRELQASGAGRWYAGLESKEKNIVTLLGFLGAVLLVLYCVWIPVSNWSESEVNRYQNALALQDWIKTNESKARKLSATSQASGAGKGSLLAIISRSAKSSAITLLRFQEEGAGGVSVVLQDQIFNDVIIWLESLEKKSSIEIRQLSIDAYTAPGKINARIIFI